MALLAIAFFGCAPRQSGPLQGTGNDVTHSPHDVAPTGRDDAPNTTPSPPADAPPVGTTYRHGISGYTTDTGQSPPTEFETVFAVFAHLREVVGPSGNLGDVRSLDSHLIAPAISSVGIRLDGPYIGRLEHNPVSSREVELLIASRHGLLHDVFVHMGYSLSLPRGGSDIRVIPFEGGSRATFAQYRLRTRLEDGVQRLDLCEYPHIYVSDL